MAKTSGIPTFSHEKAPPVPNKIPSFILNIGEVFFKVTESLAVTITKSILKNSMTGPGFKNWVAGSSTWACVGVAFPPVGSGASQSSQAFVFFSGSGVAVVGRLGVIGFSCLFISIFCSLNLNPSVPFRAYKRLKFVK